MNDIALLNERFKYLFGLMSNPDLSTQEYYDIHERVLRILAWKTQLLIGDVAKEYGELHRAMKTCLLNIGENLDPVKVTISEWDLAKPQKYGQE